MAVFREAFNAMELIQKNSSQVFSDAADYGAPYVKGDKIWDACQQLASYHDPGTEKSEKWKGGKTLEIIVIDEWAVSDGRKTVEQATFTVVMSVNSLKQFRNKPYLLPKFKDATGFVSIHTK